MGRQPFGVPVVRWVDALLDQLTCIGPLFPCLGQAQRWILALGEQALFAGDPVAVAPELGPRQSDLEKEPAGSRQLD